MDGLRWRHSRKRADGVESWGVWRRLHWRRVRTRRGTSVGGDGWRSNDISRPGSEPAHGDAKRNCLLAPGKSENVVKEMRE